MAKGVGPTAHSFPPVCRGFCYSKRLSNNLAFTPLPVSWPYSSSIRQWAIHSYVHYFRNVVFRRRMTSVLSLSLSLSVPLFEYRNTPQRKLANAKPGHFTNLECLCFCTPTSSAFSNRTHSVHLRCRQIAAKMQLPISAIVDEISDDEDDDDDDNSFRSNRRKSIINNYNNNIFKFVNFTIRVYERKQPFVRGGRSQSYSATDISFLHIFRGFHEALPFALCSFIGRHCRLHVAKQLSSLCHWLAVGGLSFCL